MTISGTFSVEIGSQIQAHSIQTPQRKKWNPRRFNKDESFAVLRIGKVLFTEGRIYCPSMDIVRVALYGQHDDRGGQCGISLRREENSFIIGNGYWRWKERISTDDFAKLVDVLEILPPDGVRLNAKGEAAARKKALEIAESRTFPRNLPLQCTSERFN